MFHAFFSAAPLLPRIFLGAIVRRTRRSCASRAPHNRRLAEKFAPSLRPAQGMCAFPPRLGQEPPAPRRRGRPASGMPLTH